MTLTVFTNLKQMFVLKFSYITFLSCLHFLHLKYCITYLAKSLSFIFFYVFHLRFLDDRTFATGSDDCTVALWDFRNVKQKVTQLQGHRNWVKSIEYSPATGQLISSGFDGKVYAWDINRYIFILK